MLHISEHAKKLKNLRLRAGGTFLAIREKMAKVAANVGGFPIYTGWLLTEGFVI